MFGRVIRSIEWARDNPVKAGVLLVLVVVAVVVAAVALRTDLLPDRAAIVVGALALAGLAVYGGARQIERVQALLGAEPVEAGTLEPGFVKLEGSARPVAPDGTVTSRHRDGAYLAYRYERKEKRRRRRDRFGSDEEQPRYETETVTVDSETEVVPFRVDDGTGSVLVDAARVEMEIAWDEDPFLGGAGEYWAAVEPGDDVSVYGRAMPAKERPGSPVEQMTSVISGWSKEGVDEAVDEAREELADAAGIVSVDDHVEDGEMILSRTAEDPFLLVTDRSSVRLVAGGVGRILAAVLIAAASLVVAGLVAVDAVPLDLLPVGI